MVTPDDYFLAKRRKVMMNHTNNNQQEIRNLLTIHFINNLKFYNHEKNQTFTRNSVCID